MFLLFFLLLIAILFGVGVALKLAFWGFILIVILALVGGYSLIKR